MEYNDFDPESHDYWAGLFKYLAKGILVMAILFFAVVLVLSLFGIEP